MIIHQALVRRVQGEQRPLKDVEVHGFVLRQGGVEAETEIDENQVAFPILILTEQHVGGGEVAVDQAPIVESGQSRGDETTHFLHIICTQLLHSLQIHVPASYALCRGEVH